MRHFDLLSPAHTDARPIATVRARNLGEARNLLAKHPVTLAICEARGITFESLKVVRFRDLGLGTVTVKDSHWTKGRLPVGVPLRVIDIDGAKDAWVMDPTGRYPVGICACRTCGSEDATYTPAKQKVEKVEAPAPVEVPAPQPFPFKVGQLIKRVGPSQWVEAGTLGRVVSVEEERGCVRVRWPQDAPTGATPYYRGAESHSAGWQALEIAEEPTPAPAASLRVREYLERKLKDARSMANSYAARVAEIEEMLEELP